MSQLNAAQRRAIETLSGPVLVLAGAGTGKTRVVAVRISRLIRGGVAPERILAVTFTNKAAREMLERVAGTQRAKRQQKPLICTFHSLCVRVLRRNIGLLGYPERFIICNRGDQEAVARRALREIRAPEAVLTPAALVNQISRWKSAALRVSDARPQPDSEAEQLAAVGWQRYQRMLKQQGAVDFDDLLLLVEDLFSKFPDVLARESSLFDHVLVDEYQDTNASQYRIISALAGRHRNICVVGDDDQSIYGFRGAEVRHILNFRADWPDCAVVHLEQNYRSTGPILAFANRLISFNLDRHEKTLRSNRPQGPAPLIEQFASESREALEIVTRIRNRLNEPGVRPGDFAILFRTNEQPRLFEQELRKARVPYVLVGSMSFFDRKEVKDVTAWLRLLDNPADEMALRRVFNVPPRGLGAKAVERLLEYCGQTGTEPVELVREPAKRPSVTAAVSRGLDQIREVLQPCEGTTLVERARRLVERIRYRDELQRCYDSDQEREARWGSVEQIINALAVYEKEAKQPSLGEFLEQLTLDEWQREDEKDRQLSRNAVALMTLHSAKGLEFPEVFMVGLEENILPHHRSLADEGSVDEERRLCYVGITRAMERLTLSMALTRMKWGKPRDTIPSRFLYEMTGKADHPKYLASIAGDG